MQAQSALSNGKFKHAFQAAKSAARKKPRSPFAPNLAGIALGQMGKHREAVVLFKKVLKLNPHLSDTRRNLAQSLLAQEDSEGAHTLLTNLVRLTPEDADSWCLLAQTALQTGNAKQAEHAAGQAIKFSPALARNNNIRALVHNQLGLTNKALRDLETALQHDPANVEALVNMSLPLARQTRFREAADAVDRALDLAHIIWAHVIDGQINWSKVLNL